MRTEKDIFHLAQILVKSLKESLTAEEQEILDQWLAEDQDHLNLYEHYASDDFVKQKLKSASGIAWREDYESFMQRYAFLRRQNKWRQRIKYAAIFLLPLSLSLALWLKAPVQPVELAVQAPVVENNKPVLTLAGGERIILADSLKVSETDGTWVAGENGELVYTKQAQDTVIAPQTLLYNRLEVPRGAEYFLTLADGSKIWLNSETVIRYPVNFAGKKREIYLEGEAFFKVAKDPERPFVVHAAETKVEVLGTEFNVRNYSDELEVATTLVNGSVRLTTEKQNRQVILEPGEQGCIDKTTGNMGVQTVDTYLFTAWKDARFVFRNTRMEDLLNTLSRWYDLTIFYQNNAVKDICFTGDMARMVDFRQLLGIIEANERIQFRIRDRAVTVSLK